jgi:hypothetical protein
MYQVNPAQLIQMIKQGQNPQQLLMNILEGQAKSNPMSANLLELAKKGDSASIEQIARNLCQSKGIDFDKEFSSFKQSLGVK